jgi:hypothetical protein
MTTTRIESDIDNVNERLQETISELITDGFSVDTIFFSLCYARRIFRGAVYKGIQDLESQDRDAKLKGRTIDDYLNDVEDSVGRKIWADTDVQKYDWGDTKGK